MTDFKNSETARNLMRAFAGESQARSRYTMAADLARFQNMPAVEAVFRYTADQEKEHARIFYEYLEPLDKETVFIDGGYPVDRESNTLAQLNAAAHNEFEEHDVVYRSFAETAQKEGYPEIAASFRMIAGIEKIHGERFQYLSDLLGAGALYKREKSTSWVCTNCGYVYEGKEPPRQCPVCHHEQGYFAGEELAPWFLRK
ncbi:MAG: rubrerythrin [Enterocloster sp.]